MVRVAQAASDENWGITGKTHGDQRQGKLQANGTQEGEVNIVPWYDYEWTHVFRPISPVAAETIAREAEKVAKNANVGYSQPYCMTFYNAFQAAGWDADKITTPCGTHCAALVAALCNAAGISVYPTMYTGNQVAALTRTGAFDVLTDDAYLITDENLKRGDILFRVGHTCVVLDDARELKSESYIVTGSNLRLRKGPGTEYGILAHMQIGETFDVFSFTEDGEWAQGEYKGLTGYASMSYLAVVQEPETNGPEEVSMTTTGKARMRKGAGLLYATIGFLPSGAEVIYAGETDTDVFGTVWYKVVYGAKEGWVSGKLLKNT